MLGFPLMQCKNAMFCSCFLYSIFRTLPKEMKFANERLELRQTTIQIKLAGNNYSEPDLFKIMFQD